MVWRCSGCGVVVQVGTLCPICDKTSVYQSVSMRFQCAKCGYQYSGISDAGCPQCARGTKSAIDAKETVCPGCYKAVPLDSNGICKACQQVLDDWREKTLRY